MKSINVGSEFSLRINSCSRPSSLFSRPSFSRFLDARRRPDNVAPWDQRVIVINEAKMELWRHNGVAPSENSYLPVSELRRLRGVIPWHYAMRREYPSFRYRWTGRNKPGWKCVSWKQTRAEPDKEERVCTKVATLTVNDRIRLGDALMLIRVLVSDYRVKHFFIAAVFQLHICLSYRIQ